MRYFLKYNREHNTAYYALIDKGFSFNEIRFIVDSISINKFLTSKDCRQSQLGFVQRGRRSVPKSTTLLA